MKLSIISHKIFAILLYEYMFCHRLAELGDFDEEDHTPAFISEFRFMPNQSEEMELEIFNKYQSLRLDNA